MVRRSAALLSLIAAGASVAIAACSDRNDLVSANRTATGLHASPSGGTVTPSGTPASDLQITGSASTGSPFTDSLFSYTFQIKNIGPDEAFRATIVDTLPPSVTFAGISIVNASGAVSGTQVCGTSLTPTSVVASCDVGDVGKGSSVTVQVMVYAPDAAGPFSNTGNAISDEPDPVLTNNAVTINTQAQAAKPGKVVPPAPVEAVAFTTLPASPDGGYVFAGGPSGVGFRFTPTVTGAMFELLTSTQASGGGRSEFWIYNDDPLNPGNPGTLLFGPMFGTISSTFSLDAIAFPKGGGPVLTAGQAYWIFGFGVTGELSGLWHLSSNVSATTPCAIGPFPGIGVEPGAACRYPAFEIIVLH